MERPRVQRRTPASSIWDSGSRRRWTALAFLATALGAVTFNSAVFAVAIPTLVEDLSLDATTVQWVHEGYNLTLCAALLTVGALGDRVGQRRLILIGLVLFPAATVCAALSVDGTIIALARLGQGIGASLVMPTCLATISAGFSGRDRVRAFAVWGTTTGVIAAAGLVAGGWLADTWGWRAALLSSVPLAVVAIVGVAVAVRDSAPRIPRGLDPVGAALSALALAVFVFALVEGDGWGWWLSGTDPTVAGVQWEFAVSPIPFVFALSALLFAVFIVWIRRRERLGRTALVAPSLFRSTAFSAGSFTSFCIAAGEYGIFLVLPLWLQFVALLTPYEAALVLLSRAGGALLASVFALAASAIPGLVLVRIGLVGGILSLIGLAVAIVPGGSVLLLSALMVLFGFGNGLTMQISGVTLSEVPKASSGQAAGFAATARQVGSAVGIALLGAITWGTTTTSLESRLQASDVPDKTRSHVIADVVKSSGADIPSLEESATHHVRGSDAAAAFSFAVQMTAGAAAAVTSVGLATTFLISSGPTRRRRAPDPER